MRAAVLALVEAYVRGEKTAAEIRDEVRSRDDLAGLLAGCLGVNTLHIEAGGPWGSVHVELFHSRLRDELPDREIFHTAPRGEDIDRAVAKVL